VGAYRQWLVLASHVLAFPPQSARHRVCRRLDRVAGPRVGTAMEDVMRSRDVRRIAPFVFGAAIALLMATPAPVAAQNDQQPSSERGTELGGLIGVGTNETHTGLTLAGSLGGRCRVGPSWKPAGRGSSAETGRTASRRISARSSGGAQGSRGALCRRRLWSVSSQIRWAGCDHVRLLSTAH
jgi:hypothetical protein